MTELRPILLVDDSARDVELTLAALEGSGLANAVVVVRDGTEALDFLHRRGAFAGRSTPDPVLAVLDIRMPKVSGLELLEAVRRDESLRHLPVIMLTSSREESDLIRSRDLGVHAFVVKPLGFREFFEAVQDLGGRWAVMPSVPGA